MQWNLDTKTKVFHESISCFMPLELYFMKCSEKKNITVYLCLNATFVAFRIEEKYFCISICRIKTQNVIKNIKEDTKFRGKL